MATSEEKPKCKHEPDVTTVTPADSGEDIVDISCRLCGLSGSFIIDPKDINW